MSSYMAFLSPTSNLLSPTRISLDPIGQYGLDCDIITMEACFLCALVFISPKFYGSSH